MKVSALGAGVGATGLGPATGAAGAGAGAAGGTYSPTGRGAAVPPGPPVPLAPLGKSLRRSSTRCSPFSISISSRSYWRKTLASSRMYRKSGSVLLSRGSDDMDTP
jgi:hypothetical protein